MIWSPPLNVSAFLDELAELTRKYGIAVSGSDWGAVLSRIERDPGGLRYKLDRQAPASLIVFERVEERD